MLIPLLILLSQSATLPDVVYSTVDGQKLKMDIYKPQNVTAPTGAVVVIHGGGWSSGKKEDLAFLARHLSTQGLVGATIEYRLAPASKWPAMLDDCQTAVRFLRANAAKYGIDPKRIGAAGASAGGHLAVFLGAIDTRDKNAQEYKEQSSKVKVVLDMFGPVDFNQDFPQSAFFPAMFESVVGKKFAEAPEIVRSASPLNYIDKSSAPVFIFQGLADPLVNPHQSRILEEKYKSLGVPVEAHYLEGVGHEVPLSKPGVLAAAQAGVAWLVKYLK